MLSLCTKKSWDRENRGYGGFIPAHAIAAALADKVDQHAELAPLRGAIPKIDAPPPTLKIRRITKPQSLDELSNMQKTQLSIAGQRRHEPEVDAWFAQVKGRLKVVELDDRTGKRAYDAYLYLTDSGTIFRAGTTKIAAVVIQTGIEGDSAKVNDELHAALVDHL